MDQDFPAAHSMDTDWFAVDAAGHVAIFNSGENGHVPVSADGGGYTWLDTLWEMQHPGHGGQLVPHDVDEMAGLLGIFFYDYCGGYIHDDFDVMECYTRAVAPEKPLHVDQLPPEVRRQCNQTRFVNVDFATAEELQPLEFFPCSLWYGDSVAYLGADGETVRPIPGQEGRFAEFCRELRERSPEEARKYRFEGPQE